jgi:hypothetical protein
MCAVTRRVSALLLGPLFALRPTADACAQPLYGPPPPAPPDIVARDAAGAVTLRTMRLPGALEFDGVLDEPFYREVPPITDFIQQEPAEGEISNERTEVWIFYDETNLYVTARLWETQPERRVDGEMRRDAQAVYENDHIAVALDPFYDRRNGYGLMVSAGGALFDWSISNEQPNPSWNGLWDGRVADFDGGWSVEITVPFRSVRFQEDGTVWGINFRRMVRWRNELSYLTPAEAQWARGALSRMMNAATLTGLEVPGRGRNIDLKPYALGSLITDRNAVPPYANDGTGDIGFDVRWAIRQTLTADVTVNTDFAQVEDDEAQVNLTRFSLTFPEKREFFIEGVDTFRFGESDTVFYTRRIGLDNGVSIPILAGGRVMGRTGRWRYGALTMQTAESTEAGSPSTTFTVARASRDVFARSRIGAIVTWRDPSGLGDDENLAAGFDADLNLTTNTSLTGYVARTHTPGRTGDDVSYSTRFDWNADRYGLAVSRLAIGDHFNPEVGLLRRTAYRQWTGYARFSPRPDWPGVRKVYYEANADYLTDTDEHPESKSISGEYRMDFDNSDSVSLNVSDNFERLDNRFEVGRRLFVPAGEYTFREVRGSYTRGLQRRMSGTLTLARGGFYDGTRSEVTFRGRVELPRQIYVEPTASWNRVEVTEGEADTNLVSTRTTVPISPRMFVSALVQYQSRTDSVTSNARFRWEYRPGSELFIVYSDGRTTRTRGFPDVQNRSFVIKVTRLLRW